MKEFFNLFVFGSFFSVGIYHLSLFAFHRKDLYKLFFSLLCLSLGIAAFLPAQNLLLKIIPSLADLFFHKGIMVALFICIPLFTMLLKSLFPDEFSLTVVRISQVIGPALAAVSIAAPNSWWAFLTPLFVGTTALLMAYILFSLGTAARKKIKGAAVGFVGTLFLAIYLIDEFIVVGYYLQNKAPFIDGLLAPGVLLLFLLSFSPLMAVKSTESLTIIQDLSRKNLALVKIKDDFLTSRLQELQFPLSNIVKISESLMEGASGNLNGIQKSNISMILSAGKRILTLTNDLFDYFGLKIAPPNITDEPQNLAKLVQVVCDYCQPLLKGKVILLINKIDEEVPSLVADQNRVRQILLKLIENAIKYTNRGTISISSEKSTETVEVIITISGGAIPKNKLEAAFHTMDRTDFLSHPDLDATDLELSIVKSLVDSFGGSIWAESFPSQEFKIIFSLPIDRAPDQRLVPKTVTEADRGLEQDGGKEELLNQNKVLKQANQNLEEKVREQNFNLEQNNRKLEKIGQEITRIEKSRRNLLSNISHDLRSPMTSIQGYIEAILDGLVDDPAKQRDYLLRVQNKITGLNRLTEELFRLTQLEARQVVFVQRLVSAARLLQQVYDKYKLDVSSSEIDYAISIPAEFNEEWPVIYIDLDHIDRVFANLIFNAVKFTGSGGTITLSCELLSHDVLFRVADTGSGVAENDLPYIFDRFYMGSRSRTPSVGGSGLGLTISKEIVEYHGGTIWAESKLGEGCTILFKLPMYEETGTLD